MGCSHCYLPESVRSDNRMMHHDVFHESMRLIRELCNTQGEKDVLLLWHGGEPLQFDKKSFVQRLTQAENFFFSNGISVSHGMQTALINFDAEWGEIIKRYFNSSVGVSIDPSSRSLNGDVARYERALEKRIRNAQAMGISISANVCPSKQDIGKEKALLDWLVQHNVSSFAIDRYNSFGEHEDVNRPTNQEHSAFLRNLLDESIQRIKNKDKVPVCSTLLAGIDGVLNDKSGDRWGVTCLEDYIVINPDGTTNTCPDKISAEETYTDSNGFANSEKRIRVITDHKISHPKDHCYACEFFHWCRSGCPITMNSWEKEGECSGYKVFLKHIQRLYETDTEQLKYYLTGSYEKC